MMKISFLLSPDHLPDYDWQEAWKQGKTVHLEEAGVTATIQSWIYQTWALLTQAGVSCDLVTAMPLEGIVIFISGFFSRYRQLPKNLFLVDVVADGNPLPSTHFHLVQNKAYARWLPNSLFIPHWPQPNLIPRHPHRGRRFEKISFFGCSQNIAPELCSSEWTTQLRRELGLYLDHLSPYYWHDYGESDAVIAIRDFSRSRQYHKPATKLYNAWHAGVPFIGGRDSAYAADGRPGVDYLVATSPKKVLEHLRHLKENDAFREHLVEQGHQSASFFTQEATLEYWKKLIQETRPDLALQWQKKSALQRSLFWMTQRTSSFLDYRLKPNEGPHDLEKIIPGLKN